MANKIDDQIFRAAVANSGAVTAAMLQSQGVSGASLRRRLEAGVLDRPFRGVYIVNALRMSDSLLAAATLLHPTGAAFRFSAAHLHGFQVSKPQVPQFVAAHGCGSRKHPVEIHETRDLPAVDVVKVSGISVTSASRTICDISPYVSPDRLKHIIQIQLTKKRPLAAELVACVQNRRRSGVRKVGRLADLLGVMLDDEPFPESLLELRLFEALAAGGITGLMRQYRPPWYNGIRGIVDAADPVGQTIIEADGRQFRQVTQAHDNDRRRDRQAASFGFVVLRVGYHELEQRKSAVVSEIKEIVQARRVAKSAVA